MAKIESLKAREILDSRGNPTIEVTLTTSRAEARASAPSGMSTGRREAAELRDGDQDRFAGLGVRRAAAGAEGEIAQALIGKTFDQQELDALLIELDGTERRSRLGANTLIAVSMAFARAEAAEQGLPLYRHLNGLLGLGECALPSPAFNVLNGGRHAMDGLAIQEFLVIAEGARSFSERIEAASALIASLKDLLRRAGLDTGMGDEGGFAPRLASTEEALDMLAAAAREALRGGFSFGIDAAASGLWREGAYHLGGKPEKIFSPAELKDWYLGLAGRYPLRYLEDPFEEDDLENTATLREALGGKALVVGDDLTVTSASRIREAAERRAVSAVIIKPNQIGTVTETLEAIRAAREEGLALCASHRSGETNDAFIADLAVAAAAEHIKAGSLARGERVAKYNRLAEIEEELSRAL